MAKELNALEQVLVDTIQKATAVTGEAIDGVKGVTGKAIDFASAQIPDVIHQLLLWKMAEALVYVVISAIVIWKVLSLRSAAHKQASEDRDAVWLVMYYLFGVTVVGGISAIAFIGYLLVFLKIWIAPKLYLIEYVAKLIK